MVTARSQCKTCLRKCKLEFDKGETAKLAHAMFKNAKLYWSTLKQYANVKQCPVSLTVLSGILVV